MADYEKCAQGRCDCIFWAKGFCLALTDTSFGKVCPFYKSCRKDYKVDYQYDKYPGEQFRWVKGFGGSYLISREGKIINWQKVEVKTRLDYKGCEVVHLQFLQHHIQLRISDILDETFGKGHYGRL